MNGSRLLSACAAALLVLAGCEAGGADDVDEAARLVDDTATGAAVDTAEGSSTPAGTLNPINRSGVRGTARLTEDGDEVVIDVQADGLEAGASYTSSIHEGRCVDGTPLGLPLGRIDADSEGRGTDRMRVAADRLPGDSPVSLQLMAEDESAVACANLEWEGEGE